MCMSKITIEIKQIYCWKAVLDTFSLGSSSRKHMDVELWLCFNPENTSCQVSYTIIPQFVEWTRLSLIPARFQRQPYPCLPHSILQAIFIFRVFFCFCFFCFSFLFFLLCDTSLVTIRHFRGKILFHCVNHIGLCSKPGCLLLALCCRGEPFFHPFRACFF